MVGPEASIALHSDAGALLPLTLCGSKAGASFRLAMISIISGLESLASQRRRNNVFCRLKREMGPANFLGQPRPPHHAVPGGGGMARDLTA